ncbi:MAG: anaerobic ribonucleoside-triphosphate reductase activating protein [Candidatus Aminicenantes bacterium]|nr:anaerobic ribonucleoside-triphosphate reductase activating protein [Candidatus Aminicenantes bacterium]
MVEIKGLEKFAPKDFPGHISSTIFLPGCNFRCPFCHNVDLVLNPGDLPIYPIEFFQNYLDSRSGWLDGICITGGEPLIHNDLEPLLKSIKGRNLLVKLDTNGSFPEKLKDFLDKNLIDYVAMDFKAPLEKYELAAGVPVDTKLIMKSVDTILNSGIDYMFRTTVVPGLIDKQDIDLIGNQLKGCRRFQIQQFSPARTIDESYSQLKPIDEDTLQEFAVIARSYSDEVIVEGLSK